MDKDGEEDEEDEEDEAKGVAQPVVVDLSLPPSPPLCSLSLSVMTAVVTTSKGVVRSAAAPPAKAPQMARCTKMLQPRSSRNENKLLNTSNSAI